MEDSLLSETKNSKIIKDNLQWVELDAPQWLRSWEKKVPVEKLIQKFSFQDLVLQSNSMKVGKLNTRCNDSCLRNVFKFIVLFL